MCSIASWPTASPLISGLVPADAKAVDVTCVEGKGSAPGSPDTDNVRLPDPRWFAGINGGWLFQAPILLLKMPEKAKSTGDCPMCRNRVDDSRTDSVLIPGSENGSGYG